MMGPSRKCFLVVEQFDKLTITPVEKIAEYQQDNRSDKLSVQVKSCL